MKNILVVYYTQTGQLKRILDSLHQPVLNTPAFQISYLELQPETAFPFPWTRRRFLDVFPESVTMSPIPLRTVAIERTSFDLVILAFQPWYLSPSLPVSSFLNSPAAERIFRGADILAVIGSRNMWQEALNEVRKKVERLGGRLQGAIALADRAPNLVSVITICYWMFTGKKDRFLGLFPKPGVSEVDIAAASRFGEVIVSLLPGGGLDRLEKELMKLGAYEIDASLTRLEKRGKKIFTLWANLIIRAPKIRGVLLNLFMVELIIALAVLSPINYLIGVFMKACSKKSGDN